MHTTEQATALWCPMARVVQIGAIETSSTYNRALVKTHRQVKIADQTPESFELGAEPKTSVATLLTIETQLSGASNCLADKCAMWRWATNGDHEHDCRVTNTVLTQQPPQAGFCGLASAPVAM